MIKDEFKKTSLTAVASASVSDFDSIQKKKPDDVAMDFC
jgi:hypothetical protein